MTERYGGSDASEYAKKADENPDENSEAGLGTVQGSKGKKKTRKSLWGLSFADMADKPSIQPEEGSDHSPKGFDGWLAGLGMKSTTEGDQRTKPGKKEGEETPVELPAPAGTVDAEPASQAEAPAGLGADGQQPDNEIPQQTAADVGDYEQNLEYGGVSAEDLYEGEAVRLHGDSKRRVIPLAVAAVHGALPGGDRGEPVLWDQQPLPQHQGSDASPAPEATPGGGGEVPPVEPPGTAEAAADEPEPEHSPRRIEPAEAFRRSRERLAAQAAASQGGAEQDSAAQKAVRDVHRSVKRGLDGVRAGLAGLGVKERHRHKRHERKAEERSATLRHRMDRLYKRRDETLQEQIRQHASSGERLDVATRNMNQAAERYNEQNRRAEQAIGRANEQTAQVQERLQVPPEHRLEKSAGGYIAELDRNGRVVAAERSAVQYGHEFHHDQAVEAMAAQQRDAADGGVALFGIGNQNQGQAQQPFISGGAPTDLPNASMQGRPSNNRSSDDGISSHTDSPAGVIWPWAVALLVVIIALIVALA